MQENWDTKEPFKFIIGAKKVFLGFEIAVLNLSAGQEVTVLVKSKLAYGKVGQPPEIMND